LTQSGIGFVGTLLIGFLTLAMIIGVTWAPETRGKALLEIEEERYGTLDSSHHRHAAETEKPRGWGTAK
jgi:inositol transporter-like SP family MFS transporter